MSRSESKEKRNEGPQDTKRRKGKETRRINNGRSSNKGQKKVNLRAYPTELFKVHRLSRLAEDLSMDTPKPAPYITW